MAHLFAIWTLQNSAHYFEAQGATNQNSFLLQPQVSQVVSLFRMFGLDTDETKIINNFVQVGTGEGKSVLLAICAATLAILGFDVFCVCYSKYLSRRDYESFQPLFCTTNTDRHIKYGTFNDLCEVLISERGDVRKMVQEIIFTGAVTNSMAQRSNRPRILLVDEVDVFFQKDFYGKLYSPVASLRHPTITALVEYVWKYKAQIEQIDLEQVPEFTACKQQFADWDILIQEASKNMINDVSEYHTIPYVVQDDQIGYVEQDGVNLKAVHGFKTAYAYLHEMESGKVTRQSFERHCAIDVYCGNFSYAELPFMFCGLLGVTGTLKTLGKFEKDAIKHDYKADRSTFMPSVFGENKRIFNKRDVSGIRVESENDYFTEIAKAIDIGMVGSDGKLDRRAILVFFETKERLMSFYNSRYSDSIRAKMKFLLEEMNDDERSAGIKHTNAGSITLITRIFGRGTDFKCYDKVVSANGGIHVIQTFLSEEHSEEVQIMGRTARQGDPGSFRLVLLENDLEKYSVTKAEIEEWRQQNNLYEMLNQKRIEFFDKQNINTAKFVKDSKKEHQEGMKFIEALCVRDVAAIKSFLGHRNRGVVKARASRTILLLDATGSMSGLLQSAKNTVHIMCQRAHEIIKRRDPALVNNFQLQFVVYRNYSSRNLILEKSVWEINPAVLWSFLEGISASGGQGNEAIEIGLQHVNAELSNGRVTQVMLIGDAPPNTRDEVKSKRSVYDWSKTPYAQETYYEIELQKIVAKVPVTKIHSFYVHENAEKSFEAISRATNGRCEFLDLSGNQGADLLTDVVTCEILRSVGGDEYVAEYKRVFGQGYRA